MTKVDTVAIRPVDNDQPVTTSAKKKEKKRKPYVKRACLSCHSAHVACESERPCKRCKKKGIACVDYIPSKKKSSSSTKEDDDEQTDVSDNENVEQEQTSPRKKKRRSPGEPSCVVRIAAPSSSTMDEQQTSSNNTKQQQQQLEQQQSEALNNSSSTLVKSALTQSSSNSSEKKRKTASKRKKDPTSQLPSVKIEDVPLDEDSMHTSSPTITSADPVSFDPITNNNLPIPQQQSASGITNGGVSMNSTDISANDNKSQMSMYQPYFWNQNPMMQQWFAMQMAQYQAHNQHLQQTGQSQAMVYPPYFMMPVMPQQAQTSFPVQTPTSPMQTDVAMSPSTAFPTILEQPYNPYAYPYNVPKPITMLENTDDGFSFFDNSPNTYNDGNALIEELDVNNNGLVEEHSNDGYANHEEKPTQTVTTPPPNNNTTDNLAFFEDDENDYFTTSDTYPNFPDYTSSPQPTFQEPQEKRKQIASQPPQKAANDDDIIDLITSEASLLTEKAKEQQNNIQNNSPNTSVSNVDSSGINLSDMDLTVNDINYVISQAPDNMISKQTIGEIIKRIWQTQENQTKEINELKKLVSELKRMIIS